MYEETFAPVKYEDHLEEVTLKTKRINKNSPLQGYYGSEMVWSTIFKGPSLSGEKGVTMGGTELPFETDSTLLWADHQNCFSPEVKKNCRSQKVSFSQYRHNQSKIHPDCRSVEGSFSQQTQTKQNSLRLSK